MVAGVLHREEWFKQNRHRIDPSMIDDPTRRAIIRAALNAGPDLDREQMARYLVSRKKIRPRDLGQELAEAEGFEPFGVHHFDRALSDLRRPLDRDDLSEDIRIAIEFEQDDDLAAKVRDAADKYEARRA